MYILNYQKTSSLLSSNDKSKKKIKCRLMQLRVKKETTITFFSYLYLTGLSGDVVMNFNADRQPTFFVYDLNPDGEFHQVASLYYTIDDGRVRVVSIAKRRTT